MADTWWESAPLAQSQPGPSLALQRLEEQGAIVSNGFRTDADYFRLRAAGYTPARYGAHPSGDGVDLTPGGQFKSLAQLQAEARQQFGPGASVAIHNGTHVHVDVPGWGAAPDVTRHPEFKQGAWWESAPLAKQGSPRAALASSTALTPVRLTGQAHDGDTVGLANGQNGRLFGFDAFELNQTGRTPSGQVVPLGTQSRDFMLSRISPGMFASPTGAQTYGRPVVNLSGDPMTDPAHDALRLGYGLAEPSYLRGSPQFGPYMEAERLARLNGLGAHGNTYEIPSAFRHGVPDPWAKPEASTNGKGAAVFADDPTPFQGLRPEIAQGYLAIWDDRKSTPEDLLAYAKANGFQLDPDQTRKAYKRRNDPRATISNALSYETPPRPLIDPGDKQFGTTVRGFADPFNLLDEFGGIADTLGGTQGRENVFNSDRRFGDILWNNIDQNRAIIGHDEATHPYYRLGGQLASGFTVPFAAAETVPGMMAIGGLEGGLAGFGAGEGSFSQRFPNAALGTVLGTAGGAVLGTAAPILSRGAQRLLGRGRTAQAIEDGLVQSAASEPVNGARPYIAPEMLQRINGGASAPRSAAMAADRGPELVGPVLGRQRDYLNLGGSGASVPFDQPFGAARNINERLSAEEMARLAEGVDPASVLPRPGNQIGSFEEAVAANPGRFEQLQAPDALAELSVRKVPSRTDFYKFTRVRGPLDMTQRLRTMGGVKDEGGDLAHLGITNEPRRMEFGSNEQFLGKLVNNDSGMSLDEAAFRLWEDGYFPEFQDRPTPDDLLERLHAESTGAQRYFDPADLNEIHAFHDAQAERGRIEAAKDAGAPLVEDRTHTISLDDLEANTPPVDAYEERPRITGRIGNINLDRLDKPQDVSQLIDQVSNRVGGFSAAARGKVTHDETRALAQEIGLTPEQLLQRRQGQALNAEQLHASRVLVQASRIAVARLAKRAVGGADEDVLAFRKAWLKHVALEEQVAGATAEAARALSQQRMIAHAQDAGANAVRSYLKGIGGRESIEDAAQKIVDLSEDPAQANHFMREAVKPRWRDKFNELWINSLLSGPRTHVVNFVGNALTTAMSFPELAMTAAIGKVTRSADRAYFGEVGARAAGMADSSIEALQRMRSAFKTGEPIDQATKVEAVNHEAIGGTAGRIIRTPTRALTAADEFWKTYLTNGELRQIAWRKAAGEATDKADFQQRYQALLRVPTDDMVKQAQASARYFTFQKELGPAMRGVSQWANNSVIGKIILPFVRTPTNILKFAADRSPFAILDPEVRTALRAGGRARDEALARITLGSGLSLAAASAAVDGRISGGGPTDPRERAALLQSGWQPYSIRIGDKWVSYSRFDPPSTLIGVAADFAEAGKWATKKEADAIALNLAESIAKNITNKTWLSGLSDAFDVLSDPERYGKSYVQRLVGSMVVPAAVSQTAQALDSNLRDARTIMDSIKARIPVLSESVPVRRNVWGEPVSAGDAIGPNILSPFYASKASSDALSQEVARLRVPLSMPQRYITVDGQHVPLDAKQYDEMTQLSGQPAKQYLEQAIRSPEWRSMNDDDRREFVKDALADYRDAARDALLERHPELAPAKPGAQWWDAAPMAQHPQAAPPSADRWWESAPLSH